MTKTSSKPNGPFKKQNSSIFQLENLKELPLEHTLSLMRVIFHQLDPVTHQEASPKRGDPPGIHKPHSCSRRGCARSSLTFCLFVFLVTWRAPIWSCAGLDLYSSRSGRPVSIHAKNSICRTPKAIWGQTRRGREKRNQASSRKAPRRAGSLIVVVAVADSVWLPHLAAHAARATRREMQVKK